MQTALKRDAFSAIMPFKVTDFGTDRKLMFDFPSTLRPATSHCETRHIKYKICLLWGLTRDWSQVARFVVMMLELTTDDNDDDADNDSNGRLYLH